MENNSEVFNHLKEVMIADISMTHPNPTVHRAILYYTLAIHSLLYSTKGTIKEKAKEAIEHIQKYES